MWGRAAELTVGGTAARMLKLGHAAVFHALHMAIDHFDVPALYLVDFSRQVASPAAFEAAEATARAWGCWRPFATAAALTGAFLPAWKAGHGPRAVPGFAAEVVEHYGPVAPLPRPRQLMRKLAHFDDPLTALHYVAVQARRNAHELIERRIRKRSPRERLPFSPRRAPPRRARSRRRSARDARAPTAPRAAARSASGSRPRAQRAKAGCSCSAFG